jgi:hypothetical protein
MKGAKLVDRARHALAESGTLPPDVAGRLPGCKALRLYEDLLDLQGGGSFSAQDPGEPASFLVRLRRGRTAAFCPECCYAQCDPRACGHACHGGEE